MDLTPYFNNVPRRRPLVHCLTNFVTVNDCANILLACGASPTMADEPSEVEEITAVSAGLYINIGTLHERACQAMLKAGLKAAELGKPVILDPVGVGASRLRMETVRTLLDRIPFCCIRGNISEITSLRSGGSSSRGVDAEDGDLVTEENLEGKIALARDLSRKTGAVIAVSGPIDLVSDGERTALIRNGHPMMARVTGTGCMLTAMLGAYCAATPDHVWEAVATGIAAMGLAGEHAYEKVQKNHAGTGSFRTWMIDEISNMTAAELQQGARIEIR